MRIDFAICLFVAVYIVQLLLCFKAKNRQIKLIPLYADLLVALLGLCVYCELFGDMSGGFMGNVHILLAIIIWITTLVVLAALLFATITYLVVKNIKRKREEK